MIFSNTAKFLFVSSTQHPMLNELSEFLPKNGIFNFAAAFEDKNGEINVKVSNHFTNISATLKSISKSDILSTLYPNKLENMHRTPIRVLAHEKLPNVEIEKGRVVSINSYLFNHIAERLNSTIEMRVVKSKNPFTLMDDFLALFNTREIDTTLSSIPPVLTTTAKVISYIENGFCALIPSPKDLRFDIVALVKVFDGAGLVLITITTAFYMVFWTIYKSRGEAHGSPWNIVFGFFAAFVGQGFKLRTTQTVMKFLFMTFVFASIVLSNYFGG